MMGMISWSISLMNYIVDEIITLRDTLEEEDALGDLLTPELLDQKCKSDFLLHDPLQPLLALLDQP